MNAPPQPSLPHRTRLFENWEAITSDESVSVISEMFRKAEDGTILAEWHLLTINVKEAPPVIINKLAELETLIREHSLSPEQLKAASNPP
ncbi:MAG: hypothetical protein HC771_22280 [Synechococcales cyanobacterium CRU_2_2]|nr:hypothetical protein [Synechococcales cyanobacterium CRU_2_2]